MFNCGLAQMIEITVKDSLQWETLKGMEGIWEIEEGNVLKETYTFLYIYVMYYWHM